MDRKSGADQPLSSKLDRGNDASPVSHLDEHENAGSPRKRQKHSPSVEGTPAVPISKKGKACIACRKLKVKCDSAERGTSGCSRCQRLGLECVNVRRLTMSLEDNDIVHPTITRLNRAVEDILQKMKMPPLESYSKPAPGGILTLQTNSEFQATRENSRELADGNDIAPAPMGSLYEVTKLNSLRSRLRIAKSTQKSSRGSMEHDLIASNLISIEDSEEMFGLFKTSLARYLFSATMSEDTTLMTVRESSTLLFTAVMLVSALHLPGKESVHEICHKQFLELIATSMFERFHTLDDIRGLCIAAFWQPDLSWKLSGLCIRMATELNLHQAFYSAFYIKDITEDQRKIALEKARIWYLLYVLDHHFSIAYGRPPVTAELLPIKEYDVFVNSPWCTLSDRRIISQVSIFVTLSKAFEVFGLESERLMRSDDGSLLMHARFTEDIRAWHDRWTHLVLPDKYIAEYPSKGVDLHYQFSSLVLNSLALRGRPLDSLSSLPSSLRTMALNAIEAAHEILQFFLEERSYRDSLVGIPLYLHSMIAFAVVFLMKMAHRWHTIGITTDPESRTKPLIEGIINTLRQCKAGANHMVYSMASGFERMLKTSWGKDTAISSSRHLNPKQTRKRTAADRASGSNGVQPQLQPHHQHQQPQIYHNQSSTRTNIANNPATSPDSYTTPNPILYQHQPQPTTGATFSSPSNPDANFYDYQHLTAQSRSNTNPNLAIDSDNNNIDIPLPDPWTTGFENDMLWSAGMGYDLLHTNRQDLTLSDFGLGLNFY